MKVIKRIASLIVSLAVVFTMVAGMTSASAVETSPREMPGGFEDTVSGAWYDMFVSYARDYGMMYGISDTEFGPDMAVTRGQFVTVLGRAAGENGPEADLEGYRTCTWGKLGLNEITDCPDSAYYTPYVKWAMSQGYSHGTSATTFSPNELITREQMATMIYNYFDQPSMKLPEDPNATKAFTDSNSISSWAKEGVEYARKTGLIAGVGNGKFEPKGTATRAQCATILTRLFWGLDEGCVHTCTELTAYDNYRYWKCSKCGYIPYVQKMRFPEVEDSCAHEYTVNEARSDRDHIAYDCELCGAFKLDAIDPNDKVVLLEQYLFEELNAARLSCDNTLTPFVYQPLLQYGVTLRSIQLVDRYSHWKPDGTFPHDAWCEDEDYISSVNGAEIIGKVACDKSFSSTKELRSYAKLWVKGMMNSPGHKAILLSTYDAKQSMVVGATFASETEDDIPVLFVSIYLTSFYK